MRKKRSQNPAEEKKKPPQDLGRRSADQYEHDQDSDPPRTAVPPGGKEPDGRQEESD